MAVEVIGLKYINAQLSRSAPLIYKAVRRGMLEGAEPVRRDAGDLSRTEVSGMKRARLTPPPWSIQKIGATQKEVYMVPREKGTRGDPRSPRRRPNFTEVMLGKSYEPALERNVTRIRTTVETTLGEALREI